MVSYNRFERTYDVMPADSGRCRPGIPEEAVVVHVDNSAEAQTRANRLSGVGARLVQAARRGEEDGKARAAKAMEKASAEKRRRIAAEAAAARAQAAAGALVRGDPCHPSLTRLGRAAAEAINSMTDREQIRRRYEAMLEVERKKRLKHEQKYS